MLLKDFDLEPIGVLGHRKSTEIESSRFGVGFECLDREMWDVGQAWPVLNDLGVKWARVQTGWAKCEKTEGVYDFQWLDDIVGPLIERGVAPWLSVSYGNPVYTSGAKPHGVGSPPVYTEREREGWQKFVHALAEHVRDRVQHYEIWNEADLGHFFGPMPKASLYVDLVRMTSDAIKAEQPDARIIGGAIAWGMTPWALKFLEDCMELGLHELVDTISYHGYKSLPERHTPQEYPAFKYLLNKYKPSLQAWQGETGMPSYAPEGGKGGAALTGMKLSEEIQARMLLRRLLNELHHDCRMVSYFHMADFGHYAEVKKTFHYGLLRLEDGSPKPSYYALQALTSLLCDPLEPAAGRFSGQLSLKEDADEPYGAKPMVWQINLCRGDVPVFAWWLPDPVTDDPSHQSARLACWLNKDLKLNDPVLVDPATQKVYSVKPEMDKRPCDAKWQKPDPDAEGIRLFYNLPVSNSPMILTDRSIVLLADL